jgi:hypothetical protein
LQQKGVSLDEVVDAKKNALGAEAAWQRLAGAAEVHVASGRNIVSYRPHPDNKDDLLSKAVGRSGNLRAPTLLVGEHLLIGYNDALYERFLEKLRKY